MYTTGISQFTMYVQQIVIQNIERNCGFMKKSPFTNTGYLVHFNINVNIIPHSGTINVKMFKKLDILLKYSC